MRLPERSKGAACKTVVRGFESRTSFQFHAIDGTEYSLFVAPGTQLVALRKPIRGTTGFFQSLEGCPSGQRALLRKQMGRKATRVQIPHPPPGSCCTVFGDCSLAVLAPVWKTGDWRKPVGVRHLQSPPLFSRLSSVGRARRYERRCRRFDPCRRVHFNAVRLVTISTPLTAPQGDRSALRHSSGHRQVVCRLLWEQDVECSIHSAPTIFWRVDRAVEGARLLSESSGNRARGFEFRTLRHIVLPD